jgi:uncharacterized protein involved in exopolysaccharide biosynthesis
MERLTIKGSSSNGPSPFWGAFVLPTLKYKRVIYAVVASSLLVTLTACLIIKNKYTSTATILPSSTASLTSELKDLAAGSLGELGLGGAPSLENVSALYPAILTSRMISERIIERQYVFEHKSKTMAFTLEEYIDAANLDKAIESLRKIVGVAGDKKTGVVSISVTTKYPGLSAAVAHAYLEELDNYNVSHRRSTASQNEEFTTRRLIEIRLELGQAEDTLRTFKESNLNYMISNDPGLQLELTRLQREVDIKSALYLTMSQQNELARIEAAKDVPVIQVLDKGSVPLVKSSPRRSLYLAAALLGSLAFSIILALWIDLFARRGVNRDIKLVIASPSVRMNKFEARIAGRISRLAEAIGNQSDPNAENNKQ